MCLNSSFLAIRPNIAKISCMAGSSISQARSQGGGSGGSADPPPPLRTKGPLFGTSRVKLLRPITING